MPLTLQEESIVAGGQTIPFGEFPRWHAHHLRRYPTTPNVEAAGADVAAATISYQSLEPFIRSVCRWGGYAGIGGRVLNQNSPEQITLAFQNAQRELKRLDVAEALRQLNTLSGLGTPSFASKHLRFLRPDICPVLDRLQAPALGYEFSPLGYKQLADDCGSALQILIDRGVTLPSEEKWTVAGVEMCIFARLHLA